MLLSLESPNRSTLGTEAKDKNLPKRKMMEYIKNEFVFGSVPKLSNDYQYQRLTAWSKMVQHF